MRFMMNVSLAVHATRAVLNHVVMGICVVVRRLVGYGTRNLVMH